MLNAPADALPLIQQVIPGLGSPTVMHLAVAANTPTASQGALLLFGLEFDDPHRGDRTEVVRIDGLEQSLSEAGKLGIQLEMDPRGEERKALEQTFDVGIGTDFLGVQVERKASGAATR